VFACPADELAVTRDDIVRCHRFAGEVLQEFGHRPVIILRRERHRDVVPAFGHHHVSEARRGQDVAVEASQSGHAETILQYPVTPPTGSSPTRFTTRS
jgi:hypothetical protein